jgi:hypothetical protein
VAGVALQPGDQGLDPVARAFHVLQEMPLGIDQHAGNPVHPVVGPRLTQQGFKFLLRQQAAGRADVEQAIQLFAVGIGHAITQAFQEGRRAGLLDTTEYSDIV